MAREKKSKWTPQRVALARKVSLIGGIVGLAGILIGVSLYQLRRYVDRAVAFQTEPPRVVIKNRPVWMSGFLNDQICAAARPLGTHSALDGGALRDAVESLQTNPRISPWIRQVHQAKLLYGRRPGDTLQIDCEFRVPVAMVRWQDQYYLIDNGGCLLPDVYAADQIPRVLYGRDNQVSVRLIDGVAGGPPSPGQKWQGEDVAAGLDLVKLLGNEEYRGFTNEIVRVSVANYGGRIDEREAHLVLWTNHQPATQIRWGRAARSKDAMVAEIPPTQKLEYLFKVYRQFGRVDANRPWIDIRFDRITYPVDVPEAHASR